MPPIFLFAGLCVLCYQLTEADLQQASEFKHPKIPPADSDSDSAVFRTTSGTVVEWTCAQHCDGSSCVIDFLAAGFTGTLPDTLWELPCASNITDLVRVVMQSRGEGAILSRCATTIVRCRR